jgi:hypothetical protein
LFPTLYRKLPDFGVVSTLVHLEFYPQEDLVRRLRGRDQLNLAGETLNKRLETGIANLPAVAPDSNAAEWCSAVDIGGKEDFKSARRIKLPQ